MIRRDILALNVFLVTGSWLSRLYAFVHAAGTLSALRHKGPGPQPAGWNHRTEASIRLAIQDFQQALEKDPNFAMAHVGLADSYLILAMLTFEPPGDAYPKAEQAAVKALQIDDTLAEAHASLGAVRENYGWDWSAAEVECKRSVELDPNYVTGHAWYALFLELMGRQEDALR